MARWTSRMFDLREGEARPVAHAFFVLFLLIAGHTALETARDALFLAKLPPKDLSLVYMAVAGLSLVVGTLSARFAGRFGRRNALIGTLCVAALATTLLHAMTPTPRVVMALYVFSGLIGAVLAPQFWLLAAQTFTAAQGRRLFAPIASGGVVGGIAGATTAAVLLALYPVTSLLLVAAFAFVGTALLLTTLALPAEDDLSTQFEVDATPKERVPEASLAISQQPFVWRVALLVVLSTAAGLMVDYLFKSTAALKIKPAELGSFFAWYYAVMNGVSLVVQLFIAGRVVSRVGVAGATAVMPALLLLGSVASFVWGGALLAVLALRMVDGGLRHSIHRVASELLYLPMPTAVRERARGLIDSVLARSAQALAAGLLFVLESASVLSQRLLTAIVLLLCVSWAGVAASLRKPYLDLFRRALSRGTLDLGAGATEIDVNAAEALVEVMASPDPAQVVAALDVLQQRSRDKLIPALILYHASEVVLLRALEIFGASARGDWIPLGERLLSHADESVRIGAVRALAKHGVETALTRATEDASATVQAYALFYLALRSSEGELARHPLLAGMLREEGEAGEARRRVLLIAVADAADPRAASLVLAIAANRTFANSTESITFLARAMKALPDPRYIPHCVALLALRPGRAAIRQALVAMGAPALAALEATSADPHAERRVRTHVPLTIAGFGTQRACDFLMKRLREEADGLIRYKVLRGLGQIATSADVRVDRRMAEKEAQSNLIEHLRLTALHIAIEGGSSENGAPTKALLLSLLVDKQAQSLERAFRLLKLARRREDIHSVHLAARSQDRRARSNAAEFLDTLLSGPGKSELRELFRLVIDDLDPAARVTLAAPYLGSVPQDHDEALAALANDPDQGLAILSRFDAGLAGARG